MQDETKINEIELVVLEDEVINLHNIARTLEKVFGPHGQLSDDIRNCADRLSDLIRKN